jgi:hypothetical protein
MGDTAFRRAEGDKLEQLLLTTDSLGSGELLRNFKLPHSVIFWPASRGAGDGERPVTTQRKQSGADDRPQHS